jgi:hypothetical protein
MTHRLYSGIVWLHPPEFRRDFGEQMICIFEEMSAERKPGIGVYADVVISLVRQWFLRYGLWKPCVSVLLSALFTFVPFWRAPFRAWPVSTESDSAVEAGELMKIALFAVGLIWIILVAVVNWSRFVSSRRRACCHLNYVRSRSGIAGFPQSRI